VLSREYDLVNLERKRLKAVHDADLEKVLAGLGLLDQLNQNRLRCALCGGLVSKENLGCIFPHQTEVKVCCDKPECFEEALAKAKAR
jgi:hypothetical protein